MSAHLSSYHRRTNGCNASPGDCHSACVRVRASACLLRVRRCLGLSHTRVMHDIMCDEVALVSLRFHAMNVNVAVRSLPVNWADSGVTFR